MQKIEFKTGTFYLGDCLEIMPTIAGGSVDMVLCDLPYGTTQNKWDAIIPFEPLWSCYWSAAKKNAAVVLTAQTMFTAKLMLSCERFHRYNLVWEKTKAGGFLNARRMFLQSHEDIAVFYKKLPLYNPIMSEGAPYIKKAVSNGDGKNYGRFERKGAILENNGVRYPRSIIKIPNPNTGSLHPTQKPVALFEYLIRTYANEGETVLDNCAGSGTTAVAAIQSGRRWICIEQDPDYFAKAVARVFEAEAAL